MTSVNPLVPHEEPFAVKFHKCHIIISFCLTLKPIYYTHYIAYCINIRGVIGRNWFHLWVKPDKHHLIINLPRNYPSVNFCHSLSAAEKAHHFREKQRKHYWLFWVSILRTLELHEEPPYVKISLKSYTWEIIRPQMGLKRCVWNVKHLN